MKNNNDNDALEYTYKSAHFELSPTDAQYESIKASAELMKRVHMWAHEDIFHPNNRRGIQRTYSFCCKDIRQVVDNNYDKSSISNDHDAIKNFGFEGFDSMFKMMAFEHSRSKIREDYYTKWTSHFKQNKMFVFLNSFGKTSFKPLVDDNKLWFETMEFGRLRIPNTDRQLFNELFSSEYYFILHPQIIIDTDNKYCGVRLVVAYPDAPESVLQDLISYKGEYLYNPNFFFSDHRWYERFPGR